MQPFEALLVLAELTTAFAGFSSVVAALGKDWDWDDKARFRLQNLLAISLVTMLLCLLPIALKLLRPFPVVHLDDIQCRYGSVCAGVLHI